MAEIFKAVIMGIVEGITEWLPVSSTGHMILVEQLVKFNLSDAFMTLFRVVIQLGAIMAVVILYFDKLWPFKMPQRRQKGLYAYIRPDRWVLWFHVFVAVLPAVVFGLLLDDWMDEHLYNAPVVALMLILYGLLFIAVDKPHRRAKITRMEDLSYKHALIIGIWQVLALVPGTSRSGATIIGALLLGCSRSLSAQFTFYLAIPVMFGASFLKLVKFVAAGSVLSGLEIGVILVGSVVAFVVSMLAIKFLMSYVKKHSFRIFGWYRIALGAVVLLVSLVQAIFK